MVVWPHPLLEAHVTSCPLLLTNTLFPRKSILSTLQERKFCLVFGIMERRDGVCRATSLAYKKMSLLACG